MRFLLGFIVLLIHSAMYADYPLRAPGQVAMVKTIRARFVQETKWQGNH